MNKKSMIIVVAFALLITIGAIVLLVASKDKPSNSTANMSTGDDQSVTRSDESATYKKFAELKGEDYDRMFLSNMIAHHQGAIDMAKMAQASARHDELKALASAIVSAQATEIADMTSWQQAWGYPASNGAAMMDHSAIGMEDDMAAMTKSLEGKTGDDFDKAFLSAMIEHHTSAIDMARPAATNAQHREVKDLAKSIINAQTSEVAQMKKWQADWNYASTSGSMSGHDMSNM